MTSERVIIGLRITMLRIQVIHREMRKRIITKAKKIVPTVAPKRRKSTPQKASTFME